MGDTRVDKLADLLGIYSISVQPGQKIAIQGTRPTATPIAPPLDPPAGAACIIINIGWVDIWIDDFPIYGMCLA